MIVYDLNVFGSVRGPAEADPPLPVYPDAELTFAVALKRFKLIARWRPQIVEPHRRINHIELAYCHRCEGPPACWANAFAKEPFGHSVGEASDHGLVCDT